MCWKFPIPTINTYTTKENRVKQKRNKMKYSEPVSLMKWTQLCNISDSHLAKSSIFLGLDTFTSPSLRNIYDS